MSVYRTIGPLVITLFLRILVVPSCKNITKHAMHHVSIGSTLVWRDGGVALAAFDTYTHTCGRLALAAFDVNPLTL